MIIDTGQLARCVKTLDLSLTRLMQTDEQAPDYEIFRNAVIKGYELSLETAGKLLRRAIKEYTGAPRDVDDLPYKELIRRGLKYGLIADSAAVERWFDYRDNRNNTAHDYGVGFAQATLKLLPLFLTDVRALEKTISEKFGDV